MAGESRFGVEVLRVQRPEEVGQLDWWIHDAHVEDAIDFDANEHRAIIPFAQESAWGDRHPSMADPELVKKTPLAEHYEVPVTRCLIVVDHAQRIDARIDWGCPMLVNATFRDSALRLKGIANLTIPVAAIDIRVFVTAQVSGRLLRKVWRGGAESDRWLEPPP